MKLHEWRGHAVALMLLASGCVPEESDLGAVTPSERLDPVYEEEGDWLPSTDPAEDGVDEATLESSSWGDAPMSALPDEGDAVGDAPAGEPLPFGASSCGKYFAAGGAASSKWVSIDGNGNLQYRKLNAQGDHIMDFSYAGYGGGGAALPSVAAVETVKPSGADDTAAIAAAINRVSGRKLVDGHRGAVVLAAGTFHVNGALQISASGVVLRGSGSGNNGTVIQVAGSAHRFLRLAGGGSAAVASPQTSIVDSYVPSGSRTIHVASASGFAAGRHDCAYGGLAYRLGLKQRGVS